MQSWEKMYRKGRTVLQERRAITKKPGDKAKDRPCGSGQTRECGLGSQSEWASLCYYLEVHTKGLRPRNGPDKEACGP